MIIIKVFHEEWKATAWKGTETTFIYVTTLAI